MYCRYLTLRIKMGVLRANCAKEGSSLVLIRGNDLVFVSSWKLPDIELIQLSVIFFHCEIDLK